MPRTRHLDAQAPGAVAEAAAILRRGGLVALPTETVYGLGAMALDPAAVAGIFAAKGRPSWDPLIVHVAAVDDIAAIADVPASLADRVHLLAERFWPGPLTLLLPRSSAVPDAVTAGRPLVGVRIPSHPVAHALLREAAVPVAAPSANVFGHTSPTSAAHVLADLDGRIDAVLDAGPCTVGVESAVLDPLTLTLYRPGAVTAEQIADTVCAPVRLFRPKIVSMGQSPESLPSPGVGIRHYAPRARMLLTEVGDADPEHSLLEQSESQQRAGRIVGLLLPDGWAALPGAVFFAWGQWNNGPQLARNLFAGLRFLDDRGVDVIVAPLPPPGGLNDALRDRMEKAARES